jgi:CRP-like cAMP-binding protein
MKRLASFKKSKSGSSSKAAPDNNHDVHSPIPKPKSIHQSFDTWVNSNTMTDSTTSTSSNATPIDDKYQEPKQTIRMGARRNNIANIDKISQQMKDLHVKSGSHVVTTGKKHLELIDEDGKVGHHGSKQPHLRPQTASVSNNVMANIYSSPRELDITYTPPVIPKSDADAEFISIALQRNFVFANALSEDDVIRKREMKQVVDAFESHRVKYCGELILNHAEVGEYFYILKEGSVRYYERYKPSSQRGVMGGGKLIGYANKPGQSFGELCLLYDCPPPADCVSGEEQEAEVPCPDGGACVLWRIHREIFRQILALRTMRRDKKLREALEKVPCLNELDAEYLKRIGDALNPRNVEAGEVLFREGEVADTLYLIGSEGKVSEWSSVLVCRSHPYLYSSWFFPRVDSIDSG